MGRSARLRTRVPRHGGRPAGNPPDFGRVARRYDATRRPPPAILAAIAERLAKMLHPDRPVLEVGVGTGRYAAALAGVGITVIGLDRDVRMLTGARAKGLRRLVRGDGGRLPFRNVSVGACLLMHVLHLVPGWVELLHEIARVTDGPLVTVVHRRRDPIDSAYRELAERRFGCVTQWGPAERDLPVLSRPLGKRFVLRYRDPLTIGGIIDQHADRVYSSTWNVPDRSHRALILEIRRLFPSARRRIEHEVEVLHWDPHRLARSAGAAGPGWRPHRRSPVGDHSSADRTR